jgi:hypothetical protein
MRTYWTLAIRESGVWAPQFGDYDREVVEQERLDVLDGYDPPLKRDTKVIKSGDLQADIDAAIAKLNAKP